MSKLSINLFFFLFYGIIVYVTRKKQSFSSYEQIGDFNDKL